MSSLSRPEPAPGPPILTDIANASGQHIATLVRAPGATTATLRDAQGRLRAIIGNEWSEPWYGAMEFIEQHREYFQPNSEENACDVPQRP